MAKVTFGEYSAFQTPGGTRYQKGHKLTSKSAIPPEVLGYFEKQFSAMPSLEAQEAQLPPQTVPLPTPEQKKKLREESLKVPVELQPDEDKPLASGDFADEFTEPTPDKPEQKPNKKEDLSPNNGDKIEQALDPDFLESVSIHTAPMSELVQALFNRFGVYTVYLDTLPAPDEINPLTGERFSKYHLGIAYQAAIRASSSGILEAPAEEGRRAIDAGREASANFAVDTPPQTMGEARRLNSFDYRTSPQGNQESVRTEIVHETGADGKMHAVQRDLAPGEISSVNGAQSKFDAEEEEPLVQPNFSGKPVIRPNW